MRHRGRFLAVERAVRSELAKLWHDEDLFAGSLVTMRHTCGKPSCRCARGEKHVSLYLSIRDGGKRRLIFIPRPLHALAHRGVERYRRASDLMDRISQASLERLLKQKQEKRTDNQEARQS